LRAEDRRSMRATARDHAVLLTPQNKMPLNNQTLILYFFVMSPAVRAVYFIRDGVSLLFPVPADQFPVPAKTFPVLIFREFRCKTLKLIHDLISKIAKLVKKSQIPCYFPCFQGIREQRMRVRADFDRLESTVGWAKARSCAPCPPGYGIGGHASLCPPYDAA
jgi:hypothetical protein